MDRLATFTEYRNLLFSIAYRMLGSVMDAEDMVQETYLRWERADLELVVSPKAYLSTVITRLCIDYLKSARVRRETYVGNWLPEPLIAGEPEGPRSAELADSLSTAFLIMLESLSPPERAAFILREVFDYDYPEVASVLGKTETNCRQLVKRARDRLASRQHRFSVDPEQHAGLVARFSQAVLSGDLEGLQTTLADDAILYSDHGGKVLSARRPIYTADKIARFLLGIRKRGMQAGTQIELALEPMNGRLGLLVKTDGHISNAITFEIHENAITRVYSVMNPDKLEALAIADRS